MLNRSHNLTECTHTHTLSQTDIWLNNKNTFQGTLVNNRILGYLDPSPAIGELPPVLVHVVKFTGPIPENSFYCRAHDLFVIWPPPGFLLVCFQKPQQTSEKHLPGHLFCKMSSSPTCYKTDSCHAGRCKICSQAFSRVAVFP